MDATIIAALGPLVGVALGAYLTFRFGGKLADRNAAHLQTIADRNAAHTRESDRQKDERLFARERLARQFEARAEVHRFVYAHNPHGDTWNDDVRVDAVRVAAKVGAAFSDPKFTKAVLDQLLVHTATWKQHPPDSRPYTQNVLFKMHSAFDAEMWRVIEVTAKASSGVDHERPTVPDESTYDHRRKS